MTRQTISSPPAVLAFGLLGLIPFWVLPMATLLAPNWTEAAASVEVAYAALILSFLGGARWGLAVKDASPDPVIVGLAMTPTLAGLAALIFLHGAPTLQFFGLAAALAASWVWGVTARAMPPWYARLRTILTLGAVSGLCVGAVQAFG